MSKRIESLVATIPDFPVAGIMFKDVTPVLGHPGAFAEAVSLLTAKLRDVPGGPLHAVVAIESRGFIFGAPVALELGVGFLPVRKPGKLPRRIVRAEYIKEYGTDVLELHADAIKPGMRVAIVDDLLATGGTAEATARMVEQCGGVVAACAFLIELTALKGRDRLAGRGPVAAVLTY